MDLNTLADWLTAVFVAFICGNLGGIAAYIVLNWTQTRVMLGLEYRLSDLEGRVSREVKIRAMTEHKGKQKIEEELLQKIGEQAETPKLTLSSWTKKAFNR